MSDNRRFFVDFIIYAPSQFVPAFVGFISIPILTKIFPPEEYGQYVLAMAGVSLLTILTGWLPMSVIRFYPIAEREGQLDKLLASGLAGLAGSVLVVSAVATVVFLGMIRPAVEENVRDLLLAGGVLFVLTAAFETFQHFLRAEFKAKEYTLFSIWRNIAGLGIGIGLVVVLKLGAEGLLWGYAISLVLALPSLWRIAIGRFPGIACLSDNLIQEMLKYGFPLVMGNLSAWVLSLSDRYILEYFRDAQEVGIYSANYTIAEKSILLIASLFHFVSIPMSVQIWEKDGNRAQDFVSAVTRYYLLLCLPVAVGISVLARPIMEILTSTAYREGYRVLPFIAVSGLLFGLQQRFQSGLVFYNKTFLIMASLFIGGVVNAGLNLLFIPRYGYMAAAVNTLIGYTMALILMAVFSQKYWIWNFPFKSLAKAITAASLMGCVLYVLNIKVVLSAPITLLIGIAVGSVIYVAVLFGLQELRAEEIQSLYEIGAQTLWKVRNGLKP